MLLLENADPLLMDQPEDDLDNAFIAERIVTGLRDAIGFEILLGEHSGTGRALARKRAALLGCGHRIRRRRKM